MSSTPRPDLARAEQLGIAVTDASGNRRPTKDIFDDLTAKINSLQGFGPFTTAEEVTSGIDLTGKVAVVTGAAGGLGAETARVLALKGATVVLPVRNMEKANTVVANIKESTKNEKIFLETMELGSLNSVRECAKSILEKYPEIHILINNAGVMACPYSKTEDGFESQFGICHIGHFVFTGILAPALVKAAPSRIVNVSSGGHKFGPVRFDDPNFEKGEYNNWASYGQAKTANCLHALELQRRLGQKGVRAFSVHPGNIASTDLGRHLTEADYKLFESAMSSGQFKFKEVGPGAATQCWAATSPDLENHGGEYCEDCSIGKPAGPDAQVYTGTYYNGFVPHAQDPEAAQKLWTLSEELCGEKYDL